MRVSAATPQGCWSRGAGGADQLTLSQPGGTDYAPHITTRPPPWFSDLPPSLIVFTQVHSVRFLDLKLRLLLQLILNLVFHKRAKILQSPIANSCEPKIAGDKYRKYVMNRTFLKKIYQVPTRTHEVSDLIVCPICRENLLTSYFFFKETRKIKSS